MVLEVYEVAAELLESLGSHRRCFVALSLMFDAGIFDETENGGEEGEIITRLKMDAQTGVLIIARKRVASGSRQTIGNYGRIFWIFRFEGSLRFHKVSTLYHPECSGRLSSVHFLGVIVIVAPMADPLCYLNGATVPLSEARIGVLDLGILRGFGIYEGITSFSGEPFRFDDHWERFQKSADVLGLAIPHTKDEVAGAMRALIKHNAGGVRASLRMLLTGGEALGGLEHVPGRETFFITAAPHTPLPSEFYARGASLIAHEYQRFMPAVKSIHYITAVMLQEKRKAAGAIEILYTNGDRALECATSNVFIVKNGTVITPDAGILKGITRTVVLERAHGAYPTREQAVPLSAFFDADEAFITSSFKDIVPIVSIDGRVIGSGAPGPVTRDLMARFAQYASSYAI